MNSLKKGEGVPLLNFEGGPGFWSHFYIMPEKKLLQNSNCAEKVFIFKKLLIRKSIVTKKYL